MSEIFQIPGYMAEAKITKKNTINLKIESQETVSPEAMQRMCALINQLGWFTFNVRQIEATDIVNLPPLRDTDAKKSPAERLRGVFFRSWEQDDRGFKEFDNYYISRMEQLINHYKQELS